MTKPTPNTLTITLHPIHNTTTTTNVDLDFTNTLDHHDIADYFAAGIKATATHMAEQQHINPTTAETLLLASIAKLLDPTTKPTPQDDDR